MNHEDEVHHQEAEANDAAPDRATPAATDPDIEIVRGALRPGSSFWDFERGLAALKRLEATVIPVRKLDAHVGAHRTRWHQIDRISLGHDAPFICNVFEADDEGDYRNVAHGKAAAADEARAHAVDELESTVFCDRSEGLDEAGKLW